jgi:hypothetical protein
MLNVTMLSVVAPSQNLPYELAIFGNKTLYAHLNQIFNVWSFYAIQFHS